MKAFSPLYDFAPTPPPPLGSRLDPRHTGRPRKRDNLLTGDVGVGDRVGAKSLDGEKAWPSINHSVLSGSRPVNENLC
jgi:hypothetical protein